MPTTTLTLAVVGGTCRREKRGREGDGREGVWRGGREEMAPAGRHNEEEDKSSEGSSYGVVIYIIVSSGQLDAAY
jgi:hypothetical protein